MSFKITHTLFFLSLVFLVFTARCTNDVKIVEREAEDNHLKRAYILSSAREKGLAAAEIDSLSDEKIYQTSRTLVNLAGTTQEEMNEALTLLYRMKKSDYEKTWLLYLEQKLENTQNTPHESRNVMVSGVKNRINHWKTIFEKCQGLEESYVRLPQEQKKAIREEVKKEMRGIFGLIKYLGVYLEEIF